jgi:hypothetical protein
MAQHDYNIANQGFSSFRSDLNNALSAIQTNNSGTSRPTGAVAGQLWLDTTTATSPTLKYYDGADDISLATIDHTANTVNWLDSTVSITGLSTSATGTVLTLSDTATTSTVNLIIDNDKEIRFREATANGTNYVSLSAPSTLASDVAFTLPSADGTTGQALITNGSGVLSFTTLSTTLTYSSGTATGDNSTTAFTISSGRSVNDVLVFVNGFQLTPTTDYTISGTTLTFVTAPATSAEITYRYLPLGGAYTSANFTGNGSATTITIDSGRAVADVLVVVNGLTLVPTTDYTISGTTLTFVTAPANLAEITVRYLRLS